MSLADDILALPDSVIEAVEVPEWKMTIHVRTITAADQDAYEASYIRVDATGKRLPALGNVRAKYVAICACDAEGKRIFTDAQAAALGKKSAKALDRLYAVATRINGRTADDVKELEKNSETGPSEGSPSA